MTSKKSLAKPLLYTFLTGLKGPAIAPAAINFIVISLLVLLEPLSTIARDMPSMDDKGGTIVQKASDLYIYYIYNIGDILSVFLLICVCITSLIAAVFSFKFITSKKTVNVYYSLGISRDKLFFGKYLSGALLMVLSIALPFLFSFISNIIFIGYSTELLAAVVFYMLSYSAVALVVFSVTAAAFSAVGTLFEASIFSAVTLAFPTIFFSCLQTLMRVFLNGSPFGASFFYTNSADDFYRASTEKLYWQFDYLNPLLFDYKALSKWAVMGVSRTNSGLGFNSSEVLSWYPSILRSLCWIGVSIAVMFIGTYIFQKRKAEICGFIGTNKILNSFATFTIGFFFLNVIIDSASEVLSTTLTLVIGFALFAVLYIVIELLLLRDFKAFVRGLYKLPVEMATAGIIIAVFMAGLFGYSSRMPDISDISKVAVSAVGTGTEYGYLSSGGYGNSLSASEDFSYNSILGLVDGFTSQNDVKAISDLHQRLITLGNVDVTPYTEKEVLGNERILPVTLQFVYTLKDGRTVMRSYDAATSDILKAFLELENTDLYKERLYKVFNEKLSDEISKATLYEAKDEAVLEYTKQAIRNGQNSISIVTQNGLSTLNLTLNMAEKAELARCLYKDLAKRTPAQKYFPAQNPLGIIDFKFMGYFSDSGPALPYATAPFVDSIVGTDIVSDEDSSSGSSDVSDNTQSSDDASATQKSPLKISPLSASASTNTTENSTQEPTTETTTEATQAASPVTDTTQTDLSEPDTKVPETTDPSSEPQNGEIGEVLDKAVKTYSTFTLRAYKTSKFNEALSIVLTHDMENTINFLKSKGLFEELEDKSDYTQAEIISTATYNSNHEYFNYGVNTVVRFFCGSFTKKPEQSKEEYIYSEFDQINKYTTSSPADVSEIFKASRFLYYNNSDSGYYVRFISKDGNSRVTMFVPYTMLEDSIAKKVKEFESSNSYFADGVIGGYGSKYVY